MAVAGSPKQHETTNPTVCREFERIVLALPDASARFRLPVPKEPPGLERAMRCVLLAGLAAVNMPP